MATITGQRMRAIDTRGGRIYLAAQAVLLLSGVLRMVTSASGRISIFFAIAFLLLLINFIRTAQSGVFPTDSGFVVRRAWRRAERLPSKPLPSLELMPRTLLGHRVVLIGRKGAAHPTEVMVRSPEAVVSLGWTEKPPQPRGSSAS